MALESAKSYASQLSSCPNTSSATTTITQERSTSFQGVAHRQDDVHPGSDPEVDVRLHGISAALTHRIQQVHPA